MWMVAIVVKELISSKLFQLLIVVGLALSGTYLYGAHNASVNAQAALAAQRVAAAQAYAAEIRSEQDVTAQAISAANRRAAETSAKADELQAIIDAQASAPKPEIPPSAPQPTDPDLAAAFAAPAVPVAGSCTFDGSRAAVLRRFDAAAVPHSHKTSSPVSARFLLGKSAS